MFFIINVYSKNLKPLNKFLNFFNNKITLNKFKIKLFKTLRENPKKKKIFTLLTSPHVNKTAQEQFEYKTYKKKIVCFTTQPFLFLLIFKNLRFKYLSDVYISIKFRPDIVKSKKKLKINSDFDSLKMNYSNSKILINNLKLFELYGEFLIKNKV